MKFRNLGKRYEGCSLARDAALYAILAISLLQVAACNEQRELLSGEDLVVLQGLTVIDGTGTQPSSNMLVAIRRDRIERVGPIQSFRISEEVTVLELKGHWAVPGFMDMHAHLPVSGFETDEEEQEEILATLVAFGITTVRNPATVADVGIELRERIDRGEILGPRVFTAGELIEQRDSVFDWAAIVETEEDIRMEVRRQVSLGVDVVKLLASLEPLLVRAAIDEAHIAGVKVIGHLGRTTWTEGAEAGIDALTHGTGSGLPQSIVPQEHREEFADFFSPKTHGTSSRSLYGRWLEVVDLEGPEMDRLVTALVKNRVEVAPALVMEEAIFWGDNPSALDRLEPEYALASQRQAWQGKPHLYSAHWSEDEYAKGKQVYSVIQQVIGQLHHRGVLITAGTDLMNPWITPGVSFHRELQLLADSNISPLEVLTIATRNAAESLGVLDEVGTIEEGKRADLVILSADPIADIANTRRIESIFLGGKRFQPNNLLSR